MALSALVSLAILVDVGLIAVDLDTVLGVLAVVAITVGADKRLVAVAGSLPLVKTLGAPVSVGVAGAILVVPIAVAIVLRGIAVAVATVVASSGTGRETEDNKRFCCHDFAIGQSLAANQAQLNCNVRVNPM